MSLLARAIVHELDATRVPIDDLVVIPAKGLAALASRVSEQPPLAAAELRAHDALTRRIHELVPSLPARYGQLFEDEGRVSEALAARHRELEAALERVAGRVELAITLRWRTPRSDASSGEASSGRAYLEARAAVERGGRLAESLVARFAAELSIEQAFLRHKTCPRPGVAAIVAVLICRDEVGAVRERVASFGERSADVSAVVDGVFAPYSFAP